MKLVVSRISDYSLFGPVSLNSLNCPRIHLPISSLSQKCLELFCECNSAPRRGRQIKSPIPVPRNHLRARKPRWSSNILTNQPWLPRSCPSFWKVMEKEESSRCSLASCSVRRLYLERKSLRRHRCCKRCFCTPPCMAENCSTVTSDWRCLFLLHSHVHGRHGRAKLLIFAEDEI